MVQQGYVLMFPGQVLNAVRASIHCNHLQVSSHHAGQCTAMASTLSLALSILHGESRPSRGPHRLALTRPTISTSQ